MAETKKLKLPFEVEKMASSNRTNLQTIDSGSSLLV
jgi:hypothetical protein